MNDTVQAERQEAIDNFTCPECGCVLHWHCIGNDEFGKILVLACRECLWCDDEGDDE